MAFLTHMLLAASCVLVAAAAATPDISVNFDWGNVVQQTHTAATVEVDVMPFLGRTDWGGPFAGYYEALENLGVDVNRKSPVGLLRGWKTIEPAIRKSYESGVDRGSIFWR